MTREQIANIEAGPECDQAVAEACGGADRQPVGFEDWLRSIDKTSRAWGRLTHREKTIVDLRWGLSGEGHAYTLEETGRIFRVTRERVRQIENKAIDNLKSSWKKEAFRPSTDWNDAMLAAEKADILQYDHILCKDRDEWLFRTDDETGSTILASAHTGPLAICRAILTLKVESEDRT